MAFCLLTTHQRTLHAPWLSPNLESPTARCPQGGHEPWATWPSEYCFPALTMSTCWGLRFLVSVDHTCTQNTVEREQDTAPRTVVLSVCGSVGAGDARDLLQQPGGAQETAA